MSLSMKFSDVRGENVSLSRQKNRASWKHHYSGGVIFSQLPLETGESVKLTVRGTSIVHVGFYRGNPENITDVKELYLKKEIDLIAQLNTYKKTCFAYLERTTSGFTYKHADIPYTKNLEPGTAVWIAIYIQFGDACIKMCPKADQSELMPFHSRHGKNIQFWDTTRTTAKLRIPNPAATSCIELSPTEEKAVSVTLRLKPCSDEIKKYGLQLSASQLSSKLLSSFYKNLFAIDSKTLKQPKCTTIQSFKRKSGKFNNCDGELTIKVEHGGRIKYHHDSAGTGAAHLTDQHNPSGGITLILDMCQVSVEIIDAFEYEPRSESDEEEECSSMSSVNSTAVISTCLDPFINSPTVPKSLFFRKNIISEMPDDSSSHNQTESSTDDVSTEDSFKQPVKSINALPPAQKDAHHRLNEWVQETVKLNTPRSPVQFFFHGDVKPTDTFTEEIFEESSSARKRAVASSSPGSGVQRRKHIRLDDNSDLNKPKPNQRFSVGYISRNRELSSMEMKVDCASSHTQQEFVTTNYIQPRPASSGRIQSTEKYRGDPQLSSPTYTRLELKRSKMGVRLTLPMRQNPCRTIQHQVTYPNLSSIQDHSDLFRDDYNIALQEKYHLKEYIQRNYTKLVENLVIVPLIDHLYEAEILREEDLDHFRSCSQSAGANRMLLDILRKRPVNKNKFIAALRNSELEHLIPLFK